MKTYTLVLGTLFLFSTVPAIGQFGKIIESLGIDQQEALSDDTVVSGLKEALQVGSDKAAGNTGKLDGYFLNEAIKILMPQKLRTVEKGLRMVGYGPQVDELVLSMNRAAEQAAPFAKDIFWYAIKEMSFADGRKVLRGGDTAATEYFREKTSAELASAFHPLVKESMDSVGVTRQYKELVGRYQAIPFMKSEAFDLDHYVVDQALAGLFHILGEEERKIRTDPAAQVSGLLVKVFGK